VSTPVRDPRQYYDLGHQGDLDMTQIEAALRLSPDERYERHERWRSLLRGDRMIPHFAAEVTARLVDGGVEFIIVGGVCGILHGSQLTTQDFDVCYRRTPDNIRRLVAVLSPFGPKPRGFPPDLLFVFDERTIQLGSNFTLQLGPDDLDLVGTMSGIGGYEDVIGSVVELPFAGRMVKVLSLADLITSKEAAGRQKDLVVLPALRALLESQKRDSAPPE
jgi:hypothetical protein